MTGIARFIKTADGFDGDASLHRLTPPAAVQRLGDGEPESYSYVVVSATSWSGGIETMVFPSDPHGESVDFNELAGVRDVYDHAEALANLGAGYAIEVDAAPIVESTLVAGEIE